MPISAPQIGDISTDWISDLPWHNITMKPWKRMELARSAASSLGGAAGALAGLPRGRHRAEMAKRQPTLDLLEKRQELIGKAEQLGLVTPSQIEGAGFTSADVLGRDVRPGMRGRIDRRLSAGVLGAMGDPQAYGVPSAAGAAPIMPDPEAYRASPQKIQQDIGYLESLVGQKEAELSSGRIAARQREKIIRARENAKKAAGAAVSSTKAATALLNVLSAPGAEKFMGPLDSFLVKWRNKLDEWDDRSESGEVIDKKKQRDELRALTARTRGATFVWNVLRAIQGSRPSDYDMERYQEVLGAVENLRTPKGAISLIRPIIEDAFNNADSLVGYERAEGATAFAGQYDKDKREVMAEFNAAIDRMSRRVAPPTPRTPQAQATQTPQVQAPKTGVLYKVQNPKTGKWYNVTSEEKANEFRKQGIVLHPVK